jgi:CheY-like chemotaxis protein
MTADASAPLLLLVEDDADIREMLAVLLELHGFRIAVAAHGKEALEVIDGRAPDLVVLDMKMPVMDGWELCRILDERGDRPPIVVVTAATDPAARAGEVAADGWLAKPFDVADLVEVIHRVLARR